MSTPKKKAGSVFAVLVVIVLLLVVAATVTVNVIFSGDRIPEVFGYYLYLHEETDMEPDIPQNSLVFAKNSPNTSLSPGAKVLCYLADNHVALRDIYQITVNEDGSTSYFPGTAVEQGNELSIPRENIFAICTRASKGLYAYVTFATSVAGLMLLLVVPCVILIIMLLVKIAKSSQDDFDDEDFQFDEEETDQMLRKTAKKQSPLFDPEQSTAGTMASIEKKKSALQGNFTEKPVNENSPYQKAVQERTMKFKKVQQEDIERVQREAAEQKAAKKPETPPEKPAYVPTHEKTPDAPAPKPAKPVQSTPPTPPAPAPAPKPAASAIPAAARTSAPNIDDILNPGELRAAKEGRKINPEIAKTDSIDDLIAVLEKEKNKL